jgi:glycosyltransferase involved in cell wall biosynthesis
MDYYAYPGKWRTAADMASGANLKKTELVLVLPPETSLHELHVRGVLSRELATYRAMLADFYGITIVSFGGRRELKLQGRLGQIELIANSLRLPAALYLRQVCKKLSSTAARSIIVKSHETLAARYAKLIASRLESPLVVHSGYLVSDFLRREGAEKEGESARFTLMEKEAYGAADRIIVPYRKMKEGIASRYSLADSIFSVIPNFVDTDLFSPLPSLPKRRGQVLFVGTLSERKNLQNLAEAVSRVRGARLMIIGDGPQRKELESYVRQKKLKADIVGSRSNEDLPSYYNSCEVFALASKFESQPAALLEAMSCGACVVGTDVPGIREIIDDEKNGMLTELSVTAISKKIRELLNDPALAGRLGRKARQKAKEFSIEKAVRLEKELYLELTGGKTTSGKLHSTNSPKASRPVRRKIS